MRKDYHLHPTVISNPERMEQFVCEALRKNIKKICVTDHMPLSISNASDRIPKGMVGDYCRAVRELAKKYEGTIKIKCGIEIDFHPSAISEIERVLEEGDFDYVLASSHMHVFVKDFHRYTFNDFASIALENSLKAIETGWFDAVSHLEMYRFAFEDQKRFPLINDGYDVLSHEDTIKELLRLMAEKNMYLEINPHLAEKKGDLSYTYPQETIVRWALEKNVRFSYGSDAHVPDSVGAFLDELEAHPVYSKALESWENEND